MALTLFSRSRTSMPRVNYTSGGGGLTRAQRMGGGACNGGINGYFQELVINLYNRMYLISHNKAGSNY